MEMIHLKTLNSIASSSPWAYSRAIRWRWTMAARCSRVKGVGEQDAASLFPF